MKLNWLERDLVISPYFFTLCTNEKLFKKAMRHLGIPKKSRPNFVSTWHSNGTAHYFELREKRKKCVVVCIRGFDDHDPAAIVGLIAHEAVHVWQQIRETLGESAPSSEFEAYSIQNITQQLYGEFLRQTK